MNVDQSDELRGICTPERSGGVLEEATKLPALFWMATVAQRAPCVSVMPNLHGTRILLVSTSFHAIMKHIASPFKKCLPPAHFEIFTQ